MGLWNFVKNAGKSLGFGSAEAADVPDPEALEKEIKDLGLEAEGLEIEVDGDTVRVKGRAPSQEEKEKIILAMGNVEGVALVEDEVETPESAKAAVLHTVAKGESLWKIAEETLGSGARYPEIFEANRPMLDDPDKIYPGQVLRIPQ